MVEFTIFVQGLVAKPTLAKFSQSPLLTKACKNGLQQILEIKDVVAVET